MIFEKSRSQQKNVWSLVKVTPTAQIKKIIIKFRHFEFSKEMYTKIVKNIIINYNTKVITGLLCNLENPEKSGNLIFDQKIREKSGNISILPKILEKSED